MNDSRDTEPDFEDRPLWDNVHGEGETDVLDDMAKFAEEVAARPYVGGESLADDLASSSVIRAAIATGKYTSEFLDTTDLEDLRGGREAGMLISGYCARIFQENDKAVVRARVAEKHSEGALVVIAQRGYGVVIYTSGDVDDNGRPCIGIEVRAGY